MHGHNMLNSPLHLVSAPPVVIERERTESGRERNSGEREVENVWR